MTFIQLKDDRINLENIAAYGVEGAKKLRIYFANGNTTSYRFDNADDRDSKVEEIDKKVKLVPLDRYESL